MTSGIYEPSAVDGPLRQGEILSNLVQLKLKLETLRASEKEFDPQLHPYVIVVSQDCDLDWDYRTRSGQTANKLIPGILFCEVTTAEKLRHGGDVQSDIWKRIKINKDERYQFLQKVPATEDLLQQGLPELGIDFKRYFTLPADEVYARIAAQETQRRCRLVSPYLEHFSTRFAYYQFRIALPSDHYSEPANQ